jgi:hypothetical protein
MVLGIVVFILGFMSPSAVCLYYALRAWSKLGTNSTTIGWQARLLMVGVVLASVCQLLVTAFLLTGFRSDGQSFATPVSLPWAIANWISLVSWVLALVTVAFGKGGMRRPLLIWSLVIPVASWIIVMMGWNY